MANLDAVTPVVTLEYLTGALGSAVVSLRPVPDGTPGPIRSASLLDADDLAAAGAGVPGADLVVLAGVSAGAAGRWVDRLSAVAPAARPVALMTKNVDPDLDRRAAAVGIAVAALHAQARAELVLATVRSLLEGAASRPVTEESDLYGLAARLAAITGGLVSIEDDQSRLLAYSATDGAADELRRLSILGREGPVEHLRRLRELGVYDRLRRDDSVIEVPADEVRGWRRRLVVGIRPLGTPRPAGADPSLGTIWLQEGVRPLGVGSESVLQGAAAVAARLLFRAQTAPTQEALQIQRLFGIRGGGVDVPSLAAALALSPSAPSAVVGIAPAPGSRSLQAPPIAELAAELRLLAGAYVRESLVTATDDRLYVLVPRHRPTGLAPWVGGVLDRLTTRFGPPLRAAVAAPVAGLDQVPAARGEVDRVLDRPMGSERVTSLVRSRTPVLLGEIADLVRAHPELADPRLQALVDYDRTREASLVETLERYLQRFGDVRAAADDLHIHPNTLRYRIRRASEILGMSLDDPDVRLLLEIQLLARPEQEGPIT